ncbi:interleukin-17F-like [Mantella aurantiaca]
MASQEGPRDGNLPPEPTERCMGRRSRRLPISPTVDISAIDGDYLDGLLEDANTNSRSLSPWEYRLSTDPDRFPFVISEADCLTFACVDSEGNEDPDLISYPIQHEMMVLRRQQRDCDYTYSLETQLVTVGCTCVRSLYAYY